jgi:hypothetical protein
MSYMADRDHIAITSGDASPTRRKVSVRDAQLLRQSLSPKVRLAILVVTSRQIRNIVRQVFAGGSRGVQFARSNSAHARYRLCARIYMAAVCSHSPLVVPPTAARISARPLSRSGTTICGAVMARRSASACSAVSECRCRGRVGRPPGTVGFMKRRDRPVDAKIRGVSHHCRIVTYRNAARQWSR